MLARRLAGWFSCTATSALNWHSAIAACVQACLPRRTRDTQSGCMALHTTTTSSCWPQAGCSEQQVHRAALKCCDCSRAPLLSIILFSASLWPQGELPRRCALAAATAAHITARSLACPTAAGNSTYLYAAHRHWLAAGGRRGHRDKWGGEINPYISWDSLYGPAAVNLLRWVQSWETSHGCLPACMPAMAICCLLDGGAHICYCGQGKNPLRQHQIDCQIVPPAVPQHWAAARRSGCARASRVRTVCG